MTEDHDNSAELGADHTPPGFAARDRGANPNNINPYQAPAYHPDDVGGEVQPSRQGAPGPLFWILAAVSIVAALLVTAGTEGLALPLLMGMVGGTIRALVIFGRQRDSANGPVPAEMLLLTSTVLTTLLVVSCGIAFVTICAGGVLALGPPFSSSAIPIWSIACGAATLAAFVFLFIRSTKWSA